jgi:hypothetical protein
MLEEQKLPYGIMSYPARKRTETSLFLNICHVVVLHIRALVSKLPVLDDVGNSAGNGCATARLGCSQTTEPHG